MPRILLVDDDVSEIAALKRTLAAAGHELLLATNGTDALAAVANGAADAVLVAPECEGGEGAGLVAHIEALGVPVVALGRPANAWALGEAIARAIARRRGEPGATARPSATATTTATSSRIAATVQGARPRYLAPRSGGKGGDPSEPPRRAPAFDTSSSAAAEQAELRDAERELRRAQEQRAGAEAAAPSSATPLARPAGTPRRRPLDRAWVEEMFRQAEHADYFDLLGLPADCGRDDVLQSAARLLDELALDRCPASDVMLLDKVEEIRRVLAEAGEVLGDDHLRDEYRRALGR